MICQTCQAVVPDGSAYCSSCGAAFGADPGVAAANMRQAESMLAAANLHRMRGQWKEAEERCIEVMRSEPNNVSAHSLLGDIFRDQGRYDEAAQWYRMALDLNPASAADRAKLDTVTRAMADSAAAASGSGTQNLLGASPLTWVRALTAVSVAFMALVVVLIVAMRRAPGTGRPAPVGTIVQPSGTGEQPTGTGGQFVPMDPNVRAAAPGAAAVPAPRSSAQPGGPGGASADGGPAPAPPASAGAGAAYLAPREAALEYQLSMLGSMSAGTRVDAVMLAGRGQQAVVALSHAPGAQPESQEAVRAMVASDALKAAQALFGAEPSLATVAVSVRLDQGTRHAGPYFKGEIERAAAMALPAGSAPERILSAFSSAWWASAPTGAAPSGSEGIGAP
jgi:hypothetical protein